MLNVLELFGGIGACTKALERINVLFKIVDYVEIDKYAVKSFNAIHGTYFEPQDICEWDKDIEVDLIMHGSPCQDFSTAGKQAGGDKDSGTRSSLMYETIRIVEKLKPKYVIWENVKNLLSKKHRHNFDAYLKKMEELGYINYYQVLNAKDYGIPQNRERVFTVSILNSGSLKDISFDFPKGDVCDNPIKVVGNYMPSGHDASRIVDEDGIAPTVKENHGTVTAVLQRFTFPPKQELTLKLKDMLEDEVDEKYYLSEQMINDISKAGTAGFRNPDCKINLDVARPLTTDQNKRAGTTNYLSDDLPDNYNLDTTKVIKDGCLYENKQAGSIYNKSGLCPTITTEGSNNWNILLNANPRIRKLTPKECWRLMGFDDEDFERAKWYSKEETEKILGTQYPKNKSKKIFSKDGRLERMSNTQLYKQAGNSIVVNVLEAILANLLLGGDK